MKKRVKSCVCVLSAALLIFGASAGELYAAGFYWENPAGGMYDDEANWSLSGYPGPLDIINFNLSSNYAVQFSGPESCHEMYVRDDQVTYQLSGNTFNTGYNIIGWNTGEYGRLTVENGTVESQGFVVGYGGTSNGGLTLRDQAVWNSGGLTLGLTDNSIGSLTIEDASRFTSDRINAGYHEDAYGTVTVSGADSSVFCSANITIGVYARGRMTVTDGAYVESGTGIISDARDWAIEDGVYDPYGIVTLRDIGTQWHITNDLTIGHYADSDGSLSVTNGAKIDNQSAVLAIEPGSQGSATISGSYSEWECRGTLFAGYGGNGEVTVSDGGLLSTYNAFVGENAGSHATVLLSGAGTVWNNAQQIVISHGGDVALTVEAGATLNNGSYLEINEAGTLKINGGIVNTGTLTVTNEPLNIDAGTVSILGGSYNPGSTTDLSVDSRLAGDLSTLRFLVGASSTIPDQLTVGESHDGALEVSGGSSLAAARGVIGENVDSTGTVTVSGPGSLLDCSASLTVGALGTGFLDVDNWATVSTDNLNIASDPGGSGTLTVADGASVNVSSQMIVGGSAVATGSRGTLNVGPGGTVTANGDLTVRSPGTINLKGGTLSASFLNMDGGTLNFTAGTLNITSGYVFIGAGQNLGQTLALDSGQQVNVPNGSLMVLNDGTIDLRGGGSISGVSIQNGGEIALGGFNGTITAAASVLNTGLIHGNGQIDSQLINDTTGQIRIESGQRITITGTGPGSTNDGRIDLVDGAFECLEQFTNNADGYISGRGQILTEGGLTNYGTIALSGGYTDIRGDVNNDAGTSQIVISGGATATFYDDVHSDGLLRVSAGSAAVFFGSFSGSGGTSGTGTVCIEGDLQPGNSPAEVSFAGDLVLGSGATTMIELGGTQPGTTFDVLEVGGILTLGGSFDVELLDDFTPELGDSFTVMMFDEVRGDFDSVEGLILDCGLRLEPTFSGNSLMLTAVPEPSMAVLLLASLCGMSFLFPRR